MLLLKEAKLTLPLVQVIAIPKVFHLDNLFKHNQINYQALIKFLYLK